MPTSQKTITVVGSGYVGLITAVAFAKLGHRVICIDTDDEKVAKLRRGIVPIHEPGVRELLRDGLAKKRLFFTTQYEDAFAVYQPDFVFLCVGTPPRADGSADLKYVESAVVSLAKNLRQAAIIITKSTVPVGTGRHLQELFRKHTRKSVSIVSNPEYLREGKALYDFMNPDKIVIGSDDAAAARKVKRLYAVFKKPVFISTLETSELAKYAQNAFLATEISFANTLAEIAEKCNADIRTIVATIKLDKRVGPNAYLGAGPGYGGSCFPKDVKALINFSKRAGVHTPSLLQAVERVNNGRIDRLVTKAEFLLGSLKGKRIGFLGLAFNAGTDDVRFSPAVSLVRALLKKGAKITAYDPLAMPEAKRDLGSLISYAVDPYKAVKGAAMVVLATHWPEFRRIEFGHVKRLMRTPNVLDARNFLPAEKLQKLGFNYVGVGFPFIKGMHPSWLKIIAKDVKKLKRFSSHELRQLEEGLAELGKGSALTPVLEES